MLAFHLVQLSHYGSRSIHTNINSIPEPINYEYFKVEYGIVYGPDYLSLMMEKDDQTCHPSGDDRIAKVKEPKDE